MPHTTAHQAVTSATRLARPVRRGTAGRVVTLLLGSLLGALPAGGQFGPPPDVAVVVVRVAARPVRDEVTFIGTVEPDRSVTVQAEVAGRVARAEPREGEAVTGGQSVLAELDRAPNQLSLGEARAVATKARQEWDKLAKGYRPEEIDEALPPAGEPELHLRDREDPSRPQPR